MSPHKPRWTDEARFQLARDMQVKYYAGASIRSLAAEYDCAYGTARNHLRLVKTELRKRGGMPKRAAVTEEQTGGQA